MDKEKKLMNRIDLLREKMHDMMNRKPLLTDKEVVGISQELDNLLNQYEATKKKNRLT